MAFLGNEDRVAATIPLFEGIAPQNSARLITSDRNLSEKGAKKSTRFLIGTASEEKPQVAFKDIASGRKSQYSLGGLGKEIDRLRDRIGINPKPNKMDGILRVFRERPQETGFIELEGVGEELKVQFNLDRERNRRKYLQDMRSRNAELKARIEERIIEYNERRRRSEEMKEGFEAVENRQRNEKAIQSDRLRMLNEMLGETKFVAQSEQDPRLKLQDLFRNDQAFTLEHKRLLSIMNSESQKYNNEILESQIQIMQEIESAADKEQRQHQEDIKISEEYLRKYKRKMSNVLRLKHLEGGPKSKVVERLQIIRKINPKALENKIKQESEEFSRRMKPNTKSTVSLSKQKFLEILETQAKQKRQQVASEKEQIFRDKGLRSPALGIRFAQLPYFESKETLHTKSSLPEAELLASSDSVQLPQASRSRLLPALGRRVSAQPLTSMQLSDKVLCLSPSKRCQAEQLAVEDRILDLVQECLRVQVEEIQDHATLRQLVSNRPRLQQAEENEIHLMKAMLKSARSDEATARINHAFERHFKKQSKFSSFKIFKEHYVQVIGNIVKILEMESG